jgi:phospholipid-binding lipoprotein MlaA
VVKTSCIAALLALALGSNLAQAEHATDDDGFKQPLQHLQFNPGLDQQEFERSTLSALDVYDPLEPLNRRIYHFNYRFDEWLFLPVVDGYRYITPNFVQSGIHNFFGNIGDVNSLLNSLLQFKGERSMQVTARVLFNTTLGIGGLWDPATLMGLPKQKEDFGQTLGFYGVPSGPYLMVPIFGPSNLRDGSGLIDMRANVDFRYGQLNSPFEYEKVRYFYEESRKLQIVE